jgi:surface-anchored protein
MKLNWTKPALLVAAMAVMIPAASAFTVLDDEHVDIGVGYSGAGGWDLHVHDETNDAEYEPDEALLYVGGLAKTLRPGGSQWDFLGVNAGDDVWILPTSQNPNLLYLGVGAEETDAGIFVNDRIDLFMRDVRGPGHVSVYTLDGFGAPSVLFSSSNGFSSADLLPVFAQGHSHFFWAFTAVGLYEVDLEASGALVGAGTTSSGIATYNFGVEAVPEPTTMAALALGAAFMARRRKKS